MTPESTERQRYPQLEVKIKIFAKNSKLRFWPKIASEVSKTIQEGRLLLNIIKLRLKARKNMFDDDQEFKSAPHPQEPDPSAGGLPALQTRSEVDQFLSSDMLGPGFSLLDEGSDQTPFLTDFGKRYVRDLLRNNQRSQAPQTSIFGGTEPEKGQLAPLIQPEIAESAKTGRKAKNTSQLVEGARRDAQGVIEMVCVLYERIQSLEASKNQFERDIDKTKIL